MKANEIGEIYGWYAHYILLVKSGIFGNLEVVVDTNHREAFYALCYIIDSSR